MTTTTATTATTSAPATANGQALDPGANLRPTSGCWVSVIDMPPRATSGSSGAPLTARAERPFTERIEQSCRSAPHRGPHSSNGRATSPRSPRGPCPASRRSRFRQHPQRCITRVPCDLLGERGCVRRPRIRGDSSGWGATKRGESGATELPPNVVRSPTPAVPRVTNGKSGVPVPQRTGIRWVGVARAGGGTPGQPSNSLPSGRSALVRWRRALFAGGVGRGSDLALQRAAETVGGSP